MKYRVYELKLASDLPLFNFGFELSKSKTYDIEVIQGKTLQKKPKVVYSLDKKKSLFYSRNIALFTITDGEKIYINPHENAKELDITQSLINFPIAACMAQRGNLVLHASCATKNNKTFLFIGKSHAGKSTLAYSLMKNGWEIVSEDISVIDPENLKIKSAQPYIKLSREISDFYKIKNQDRIKLSSDKREGFLFSKYKEQNLNINKCFFLNWGDSLHCSKIQNEDIIKSLMDYSFTTSKKITSKLILKMLVNVDFYNLNMVKKIDQLKDTIKLLNEI